MTDSTSAAAGAATSSSAEATAAAAGAIAGVQVVGAIPGWTTTNTPGAAAQATSSKAANAAGRHVCTGIYATLACGATAQTPIMVNLRDGATGAGAVLWSGACAAPVNGSDGICISGLAIVGSLNTAMTLEFAAAGVAASQESVTMTGYDIA